MDMISKLNSEEFETRLHEVVKDGEPEIMGTPLAMLHFNFSSKPLFGSVTWRYFKVTRNSIFPPTSYFLMGHYEPHEGRTKCEVDLKIIPFGYYWVRLFPILGFILMNSILFSLLPKFQWDVFFMLNGFLLFMAFLAIGVDRLTKRRLESLFKTKLEIVTE